MRWIARRKTAWAISAWAAAVGAGFAVEPPPIPEMPAMPRIPKPVAPAALRADAPERAAPPIVIPPPAVDEVPAAAIVEAPAVVAPAGAAFAIGVARPRAGSVSVAVLDPDASQDKPAADLPKLAPKETSTDLSSPTPMPAGACASCDNPWAKIPPVQVIPRLGFFLIPGSGPGYYSGLDWLHGNCREKPPANPYPPYALVTQSGFDQDYRYLDNPDNTQTDPLDAIKRIHPTPDTMVTIGGQSSIRYMNEVDSRLSRVDNDYALIRNRVFADIWYQDQLRLYGEFISAVQSGTNLPPLPIDENQADILNLFLDVKVAEINGNPAYVRVGRQEMLFGSQRLISTRDWSNVRQTFQGVRGFWRSEQFDFDAFWVRPVVINPGQPDSPNHDAQFFGAWATYRPAKGQFVDLYYLGLIDDSIIPSQYVKGPRSPRGTTETHTFGARYVGNQGPLLYDFEGMVQTGNWINRDMAAGAWTAELGWEFQDFPWRPQVWVGYDYASGTGDPNSGDHRTFNQLFAFGHYYFGYLDLVGRRNIEDLSLQLAAYPDNWITLVAQVHQFRLAEARDFLYNAAGRPTRRSATGIAGRDVGDELDLLANFHLTPHQDLLIGYSKLFAGDFIKRTGPNVSPELFYLMYNLRW